MRVVSWAMPAWKWIRDSATRQHDKQRESGIYQIWDMLRHAHLERERYLVTAHLCGGGAITGRVEREPYANGPIGIADGAFSVWHVNKEGFIDPTLQTFLRLDQVAALTVRRLDMPKEAI